MRDVMRRSKQGGGPVKFTTYSTDGKIATINIIAGVGVNYVPRHEGAKGEVCSSCECPECRAADVQADIPATSHIGLVKASDRAVKATKTKAKARHKRIAETASQTVIRRRVIT